MVLNQRDSGSTHLRTSDHARRLRLLSVSLDDMSARYRLVVVRIFRPTFAVFRGVPKPRNVAQNGGDDRMPVGRVTNGRNHGKK